MSEAAGAVLHKIYGSSGSLGGGITWIHCVTDNSKNNGFLGSLGVAQLYWGLESGTFRKTDFPHPGGKRKTCQYGHSAVIRTVAASLFSNLQAWETQSGKERVVRGCPSTSQGFKFSQHFPKNSRDLRTKMFAKALASPWTAHPGRFRPHNTTLQNCLETINP